MSLKSCNLTEISLPSASSSVQNLAGTLAQTLQSFEIVSEFDEIRTVSVLLALKNSPLEHAGVGVISVRESSLGKRPPVTAAVGKLSSEAVLGEMS